MTFTSAHFFFFLIPVLGIYYCLERRAQNIFLLVASYVFYASWDPRFVFLLFVTTVVDFSSAIFMTDRPKYRRFFLWLSVFLNLGVLFFFKYHRIYSGWHLLYPIGVSFYTFQSLGYTIDVYRKTIKPQRSFVDFALFVAFFPQLLAGPIERAKRMFPQFANPRRLTKGDFTEGTWLILLGVFKKVVIADNMAMIVNYAYGKEHFPEMRGADFWIASVAFFWQIYCDFSGYTDIARGIARLMGISLSENFLRPMFIRNPSGLWQRWHITLSLWLRDYLYYPLLLLSNGKAWMLFAFVFTFGISGLWHGPTANYILSALVRALIFIAYYLLYKRFPILKSDRGIPQGVLNWVVLTILDCLTFTIFRSESLTQMGDIFSLLFSVSQFGVVNFSWIYSILFFTTGLFVFEFLEEFFETWVQRHKIQVRASMAGYMIGMILLYGVIHGGQFIYFQF